jgi:hypothetical protein
MENPSGSMGDFTLEGGLNVTAGVAYLVATHRPANLPDNYTYVTGDVYVSPS